MNNQIQAFENSEFGRLDVLMIEGKEHFPATECARMLGYSNPIKAVGDHCRGITRRYVVDRKGRRQQKNYIPEGDLYRLIVKAASQSRSKEIRKKALRFEQWIFDEVLPSIRRTGKYETGKADETDRAGAVKAVAERIIEEIKRAGALEAQIAQKDARIEEMEKQLAGRRPEETTAKEWRTPGEQAIMEAVRRLAWSPADQGYNWTAAWSTFYREVEREMGLKLKRRIREWKQGNPGKEIARYKLMTDEEKSRAVEIVKRLCRAA